MAGLGLFRRSALVAAIALMIPVGGAMASSSDTGAPGIGDPYYPDYGNGGYDVAHYGIDVSYVPATDELSGTTHVVAHATQQLGQFDLDFVLPVSSVTVNDRAASYTQGEHELVVTPKRELRTGDRMDVVVTYAGVPSTITSDGIKPWIKTGDGAAAVGEPEIAAWWYPSNDHPRDKASYNVKVTVARDLEALGNGVLVSHRASSGQRTWHWRERKPMAPYLAFFVVGQFDITQSTSRSGLPVVTAVASNGGSEGTYAAGDLKRTPEVLAFESRQWGRYPFDAQGGVAPAADFGFALENQTRPVYTRGFWRNGSNIYVIVHELAHQWYGDSVSVRNWRDIWLNEGFASFTEWLWSEKHDEGTGKQLFQQYYDFYQDNADFWTVKIGNPGAHNEFNGAVYDRGAMTLQALRTRIGNPAFFTTMRSWAADHKYGNGSVRQFIRLAKRVSGQDLTSFFDAWLYSPTRPAATRANGFPADFTAGTSARSATPASWAKLRDGRRMLVAAESR